MTPIFYRQIQPVEIPLVAALARESFDQFVAIHYQAEGISEFHRYASAEALCQRHEAGHITLVAEEPGKLVGMLQLRELNHISMLFVRPSRQRGGIGRGLIAAAGALAGDTDREFTVNSSPNAVSAYQRLGFRITGSEQCLRGIRFVPMQRHS
jgi:GNAT superfamily N-acetyltransferase